MYDVIDTRDLNDDLEELQNELDRMVELKEELIATDDPDEGIELQEEYDDLLENWDGDTFAKLVEMRDEIPEWEDGNVLVADHYWVDYVMEMLADIGDLPAEIPSYIVIDEKATAENIQVDYSYIEYEGTDYWFRNC